MQYSTLWKRGSYAVLDKHRRRCAVARDEAHPTSARHTIGELVNEG